VGIDPEAWLQVETAVDESALQAALGGIAGIRLDHAFHVAVDRWTGGAADGLLFNILEPWDLSWEPIVLRVHRNRLRKELWEPARTLLGLVLRDFANGTIPLGHGTNRGMGDLELKELAVASAGPVEAGGALIEKRDDGRWDFPEALRASLLEPWKVWIAANKEGEK
jgi:hypothetical protein